MANSSLTVTAAATERSLLTVAELRAAAGATDGSQDAALLALGRAASTALARQCMIVSDGINPPTFLRETCVETFRPVFAEDVLILARRPVAAIVSVTEAGALLDPSAYEVDQASGFLRRLDSDAPRCWSGVKTVVTYQAGFAEAPDDLKLAATRLVAVLNAEGARDPGLKRESIPGVRDVEYWVGPADDPLIPADIMQLLAPYTNRWV